MKDFKHWGLKVRKSTEHNYHAVWNNLKTVRFGEGHAKELPPEFSEFYDVGINTVCNAECDFCYVAATKNGINYPDICETWTKWMSNYKEIVKEFPNGNITSTTKPFQIAIGSTGEPTIHPDFCKFLETVYNTGVVPNYTTNGVTLSHWQERSHKRKTAMELLEYTEKYCGGVAVSRSNHNLWAQSNEAIKALMSIDVNINLHHIISDKISVDEFLVDWEEWGDAILYHVLLPMMPSGRSSSGWDPSAWEYLEEKILKENMTNVAFGAHFIKTLEDAKIKTWLYPAESMSKNVILTKDCVKITPSSFDLKPIMEIKL